MKKFITPERLKIFVENIGFLDTFGVGRTVEEDMDIVVGRSLTDYNEELTRRLWDIGRSNRQKERYKELLNSCK